MVNKEMIKSYSSNNNSALSMIPPTAWFYIIGIPIVVGGVYFLVARPIMKKLNILEDKEDKEMDKINDNVKSQPFWTPNFYKKFGGDTISSTEAVNFANTLYRATRGGITGWGTDEEAIFGVFNSLGSKGNISKVVEAYQIKHNSDLYTTLVDELDNEDMFEIAQKISLYAS
jgi:hypothetical protein